MNQQVEKITFTSVLDGEVEVNTEGILYPSGHIETEAVEVEGLDHLEREYVTKEDGTEVKVCPDCHEYTLDDKDYCRNESCEHNY